MTAASRWLGIRPIGIISVKKQNYEIFIRLRFRQDSHYAGASVRLRGQRELKDKVNRNLVFFFWLSRGGKL